MTCMDLSTVRSCLNTPLNPTLEPNGLKPASVLLLIYGSCPHIIMTVKSEHMRIHAGEASFPGGKPESGDIDLCHTALRETHEEIGLRVDRQNVIGQLDAVRTLNSKFMILPFVAILNDIPKLSPNTEVSRILQIPLEPLLDTLEPDTEHGPHMFNLYYKDMIIWGATARILYQVKKTIV